jgi:hypothetical protein
VLRGFVSCSVAIFCALPGCWAQGEPGSEEGAEPQLAPDFKKRGFDLKAVKVQPNMRIARPGLDGQIDQLQNPNLNGGATSNSSIPLADPNAFQQGKLDRGQNPGFDLKATQLNGSARENNTIMEIPLTTRLLADYQIELIVDRSLSMRKRDCPGGLSRWEWCGVQAEDLAKAIAPYLPNGLTIIPFASRYDVYQNSSAQNIADLFANPNFEFGTRLAEPLADRLNTFFAQRKQNRKPLLIAVITDGVPFPPPEPRMVRDELMHSDKKMHKPGEVTVVFFQIGGHDRFGHNYLQGLGNDLVSEGARFDYVHTISFEKLTAIGLSQALVQTVQTFAQAH